MGLTEPINWRIANGPPNFRSMKSLGGGSVMLWGTNKVALVEVPGNLNAERYVAILKTNFLPLENSFSGEP